MPQTKPNIYTQSGVNVSASDELSAYAKRLNETTYDSCPFIKVHDTSSYFRAPLAYEILKFKLPEVFYNTSNTDGVGTKVGIHAAAKTYNYAGVDALAMILDDSVRFGGLPLTVTTNVSLFSAGETKPNASSVERMHHASAQMVYEGIAMAARANKVVLIGGETAILGKYVGSDVPKELGLPFNIEAFTTGVSDPTRIITGETVQPGHAIIAFKEKGYRSNGISAVRRAFVKKFGEEWYANPKAHTSILAAAEPSIIYALCISTLHGWFNSDFKPLVKLHAVAHITGGGIEGKFGRDILQKKSLSAELKNLYTPPKIMKDCKEWIGMDEHECYTTWNGGQGMLVVVDNDPETISTVIHIAKRYGIDAQLAGTVRQWKKPRVEISSKFSKQKKVLTYKL